MARPCRWSRVINYMVVFSVSCSVVLLVWSSRLEVQTKKEKKLSGVEPEIQTINNIEESILQFRTVFNFRNAVTVKDVAEDEHMSEIVVKLKDQVKSLKDELSFLHHSIYDLKHNVYSDSVALNRAGFLPKCQVLHVAIVCAGYRETRRVVTLIKSILFHRQHPLHFHFISDTAGQYVLQVLFRTWKLQQVFVSFYDADQLKAEVDWIPNSHYSGVYGLLKLTLTKALPEMLDQVIVLDTDVFFLADIAELWKLFDKFQKQQAIGLVENQSDWYLGKLWKKYNHWPALGRGFNTGVMLLDLHRLREINWPYLWRLTAEKQLINLLSTTLADQDVINAAVKDNPHLVYTLPCQWNIQLSDNTRSERCYEELADLKIVHWNSPKKQAVGHKNADYFRNMYLTYLQYDGNLLRQMMFLCDLRNRSLNATDSVQPKVSEDHPCYDFLMEQEISRRVHLYYVDYDYSPVDEYDVTLLAHLSMDRLQILEPLSRNWKGPMSISLYVSDAEAQQFSRFAMRSEYLSTRRNIGIHIVYKDGDLYPVNYLRNVALEHVKTPYVFLCDIDFLPSLNLYEELKAVASSTDMNKKAVVVPAFETYQYKLDFPSSKSQLLAMLDNGKVNVFRVNEWKAGHAATNFDQFRTASENYKISWEADFEPYVLVKVAGLPLYDMRFVGFGWNKVSHIMELHALGYEFVVAANTFIIHMPHAPSFDITKYRANENYRSCLRKTKDQFRVHLEEKYKMSFPLSADS